MAKATTPPTFEAKVLEAAKDCGLTADDVKHFAAMGTAPLAASAHPTVAAAPSGADVSKWLAFLVKILPFIADLFSQNQPPTP